MTQMTHARRHAQRDQSYRLRQQAAPFKVVGSLAAAGWMMIEAGRLLELLSNHSSHNGPEGASRWGKVEFAAASIAVGALLVAAGKHSHASRIEHSSARQEGFSR
jgi:hypothetical protein